ncbi:hypothetical protein HanHA300_Chr03g0081431 [Helianthus annuus]|nr:hypothetical protein HanHA300_Chr03g0081431 [Helianthus annuus]KAJ0599588.1 hypothetical protein HanIR_Chr03g0106581 [Helianthus annuus]KAJ0607123.1 hypothetical protein HanHA89_Chr03g0092881 [Helianthus annuus]KAJ0767177.1 hypothetical protein HanLR1_Chr03g0086111 [Helianthus annuus]
MKRAQKISTYTFLQLFILLIVYYCCTLDLCVFILGLNQHLVSERVRNEGRFESRWRERVQPFSLQGKTQQLEEPR